MSPSPLSPILIVGAGMAGLAAARTLHAADRPAIVLEARQRLGGRTYTDHTLGLPVDLGAAWIHGPIGNPLTPLAHRFGLRTAPTDFLNREGNRLLAFDGAGAPLDLPPYTEGLQYYEGAMLHLHASALTDPSVRDARSLAELYALGQPPSDHLTPLQSLGFYYSSVIRPQFLDAADLDEIDWQLAAGYVKLPGGDWLLPGGGYGQLAAGLADGLDIRTNVVVTSVIWDEAGVTLRTSAGDWRANQVILTLPLGVLQAGAVAFQPELPAAKQAAIARLGMGHYEKLVLRFPRQFWPDAPQRFQFLTDQRPELFTSWLNLAHYSGEPVLATYHAGSRARHINRWPDEPLVAAALETLRHLFGPSVPAPTAYVRTHWEDDPFTRGSYSFWKVGSQAGDRQALAEPTAGRLFWAGEATHSRYFATVHGAYESGVRAARQVLRGPA